MSPDLSSNTKRDDTQDLIPLISNNLIGTPLEKLKTQLVQGEKTPTNLLLNRIHDVLEV